MSTGVLALLGSLVLLAVWFVVRWATLERLRATLPRPRPNLVDSVIGFVTNFFDTLGIGSFAPTTAAFKLQRRVADEQIPGTLNVGHALPTFVEAMIFIAAVQVDVWTLTGMIAAAVLGAWMGVGVITRLPRRSIQIGMGAALLVAVMLFAAKNLDWMPGGGDALGLQGPTLAFAIGVSFVLGGLMMLGIGMYAPCLILVSLLGMNPLAAFPIMMGACAFLMPVGGVRFVQTGHYNLGASLSLTLGGIPGVLVGAFIVKSLPMVWIRWLVVVVVLYAAAQMLLSAYRESPRRSMAAQP